MIGFLSFVSFVAVYGDILREITESLYMTSNMVGPDGIKFKPSKLSSSTSFRVCCLNNMTSEQINPLGMKCSLSDDFKVTTQNFYNDIRINGERLNRNIPWENVDGGHRGVIEYLKTCPNMQIVLAPDMLDHVIGLGVSGIVIGVFFISLSIGYFMCLVYETLQSREGGKLLFLHHYLPSSLNLKRNKVGTTKNTNNNSNIIPCEPVIPVTVPATAAVVETNHDSSSSSSSSSSGTSIDEVNNAIEELHKSSEVLKEGIVSPRSEKNQSLPIQPTTTSSSIEQPEAVIYDRPSPTSM